MGCIKEKRLYFIVAALSDQLNILFCSLVMWKRLVICKSLVLIAGVNGSAEDNDRSGGQHSKAAAVASRAWRRTDSHDF